MISPKIKFGKIADWGINGPGLHYMPSSFEPENLLAQH